MSLLFTKFRPSSSERQLKCTKSLQLETIHETKFVQSDIAQRGNDIHRLSELLYMDEVIPIELLEHKDFKEYSYFANQYIKYLNTIDDILGNNSVSLVEEPIKLDDLYKYMYGKIGTIDYVSFDDNNLHIVDLKTGHTAISAEDNYQLYIYAYLYLLECEKNGYEFENISIHIFQETFLSTNTNMINLTPMDLKKWIQENVLDVFYKIDTAQLQYKIGKHCSYCPNLAYCKPIASLGFHSQRGDRLGLDEMVDMVKISGVIDKQLKAIKAHLLDYLSLVDEDYIDSSVSESLYLGVGRNKRSFVNADKLVKLLEDNSIPNDLIYDKPKLLSPNKLETYLKKEKQKLNFNLKDFIQIEKSTTPQLKIKK